mgnify:CR=1 FL=1
MKVDLEIISMGTLKLPATNEMSKISKVISAVPYFKDTNFWSESSCWLFSISKIFEEDSRLI